MTKVTLYYANWCGHCKTFKSTWNSLKPYFQKYNIEFKDYEESSNTQIMKDNNVNDRKNIYIFISSFYTFQIITNSHILHLYNYYFISIFYEKKK